MGVDREAVSSALGDRYRLGREIGRGASATVFAAEDLHLGRSVAVKVLEPELARTVAGERFLREVRIEARLQHPHILPLIDSGDARGLLYCVYPLVEGTTLRERMTAVGAFPIDTALRLAEEVARALEHAHAHGVVHRDIKPENILLCDDQAIVCDFGIARALMDAADCGLTQTGVSIGTPRYMSPEQAAGNERPDPRSDLYSLGCVLHEMLVGRAPFTAPSARGLLQQHMVADAPRVLDSRPEISIAVAALVDRCLAKAPADRPASATDLADELWRVRAGDSREPVAAGGWPLGSPRRTRAIVVGAVLVFGVGAWLWPDLSGRLDTFDAVAVLPLRNLTGDDEQEYFADGVTEALINHLSRIESLRVISRTSAMSLKDSRDPVPVLARRLGVSAVVEGSVARVGDRIRVSIQLVRADPEKTVWSHTYDRDERDILDLQGDVSRSIAEAIHVRLTPEEKSSLRATARVVDPVVHEACLRGQYLLHTRFDIAAYRRAKGEFERAVDLDPTYAPAWAGLADAYYNLSSLGISADEAMPRARAAAARALELDSTLAEAHVVVGLVSSQYELDWIGSERSLRRAVALNPGSAFARASLSLVLCESGRLTESLREIRRAVELDPLSQYYAVGEGIILFRALRIDESRTVLRRVLDEHPDDGAAAAALSATYELLGQLDSATVLAERAVPASPYFLAQLGRVHARAGRHAEARKALTRLGRPEGSAHAMILFQLGETDRAFTLFARALEERDENFIYALRTDPNWEGIRADPRGRDLLRRIGPQDGGPLDPSWTLN